jgi:phosphatidylserine/phosphatidylglycerophosphate/cardiolipin synthase-like enzyme
MSALCGGFNRSLQHIRRISQPAPDRAARNGFNEQRRYTSATFLKNHGIDAYIDDRVTIAHNKVMVLDRTSVITGSFNFTTAAQTRNAENVMLLKDEPKIAAAYADNWERRFRQSRPYSQNGVTSSEKVESSDFSP